MVRGVGGGYRAAGAGSVQERDPLQLDAHIFKSPTLRRGPHRQLASRAGSFTPTIDRRHRVLTPQVRGEGVSA